VPGLDLTPYEEGVIVGVLLGEGHFGGDGRQPQITVRMHVRHEALVRWLHARIPRSRVYGPYHHGDRHYFQWMVRGAALIEDLYPLLEHHVGTELDAHAHARIVAMRERYPRAFAGGPSPAGGGAGAPKRRADGADPADASAGRRS
jgi:hypothetical protein